MAQARLALPGLNGPSPTCKEFPWPQRARGRQVFTPEWGMEVVQVKVGRMGRLPYLPVRLDNTDHLSNLTCSHLLWKRSVRA